MRQPGGVDDGVEPFQRRSGFGQIPSDERRDALGQWCGLAQTARDLMPGAGEMPGYGFSDKSAST